MGFGHGSLEGKRVFVSDMTCDATTNIPLATRVVFQYDTWNTDLEALEKAIGIYPEVRFIVVAYLYGTPGKNDEVHNQMIKL